jgi:hypothetical protein
MDYPFLAIERGAEIATFGGVATSRIESGYKGLQAFAPSGRGARDAGFKAALPGGALSKRRLAKLK